MGDKCRSCDAPILWAKSEKSGKPIPLDAEPVEDGNIRLGRDDGRARRDVRRPGPGHALRVALRDLPGQRRMAEEVTAPATLLAYLAGFIDADGYVSIRRGRNGNGRRYYSARVGIAGTDRTAHDLAASLWGGAVYRYEPKDPTHRAQYQWAREGKAAAAVLTDLLPHLRMKQRQAVLALHLHELVADFGVRECPLLDHLHGRVCDLNQWRRQRVTA